MSCLSNQKKGELSGIFQILGTSKEKIINTLQALTKPEYQGFEIRMFYLLGKPNLSAKSKQDIRADFALNIDEHLFNYNDLIKDINNLETGKLIALNQKYFKETNQVQNDTTVNITSSTVHGSVAVAGQISNSFNETHHHHYAEKPNTPPEVDISHLPDSAVAAIAMPSAPILGARLAAGAGLACTSTSTFASALPFIILGARGYGIYKSLFDDKSDDSNPLCTNEKENNHIYSVWFGTTRKPINKNDLSKGFRNERETDKNMYYGKCNVFIPKSHRFGETGRSWFQRWAKLDFENDNLKLREIIPCDNANSFWLELKNQFAENKGDALVYLHGYNTSFEEAAIRAAQIGFDLKVSGATAFFSWASKSEVSGYPNDVASIEASEMAITDFLLDFTQKSGASKVHLIAHSMGNRGLIRALNNIQHKLEKDFAVPFGQIILAAPDLDVQLFKNLAYLYPLLSERTTLYASPQDKAVAASKWLHGSPRVEV